MQRNLKMYVPHHNPKSFYYQDKNVIYKFFSKYEQVFCIIWKNKHSTNFLPFIKVAATDMRYFAKSKFFGSLVHKKDFGGYLFCQGR